VHRIKARADSRVTKELLNAFKRVSGKEDILFHLADAALERPEAPVREVIFPAVRGGEQTLRELVHEFKTKGPMLRKPSSSPGIYGAVISSARFTRA
jgi:hypothetical protein